MKIDIKLHKEDLPDEIILSDNIAVDCEFMGPMWTETHYV